MKYLASRLRLDCDAFVLTFLFLFRSLSVCHTLYLSPYLPLISLFLSHPLFPPTPISIPLPAPISPYLSPSLSLLISLSLPLPSSLPFPLLPLPFLLALALPL